MNLKDKFNNWAKETDLKYQDQQWLLSKWDVLEGVEWSNEKVRVLLNHIRTRLDLCPLKQGAFLDLGCGGGWILDAFKSLMPLSVGCDISMEMLGNASQKNSLINADACFLPFKKNSFDRILCYFVLINFEDLCMAESVLTEIVRVLKPGGKALIGQVPDKEKSNIYDHEKERYLSYCQEKFSIRSNNRDVCHIPIQLFNRGFFHQSLKGLGCNAMIIPAFNPFYRPGELECIDWRFDVVVEKK